MFVLLLLLLHINHIPCVANRTATTDHISGCLWRYVNCVFILFYTKTPLPFWQKLKKNDTYKDKSAK